MKISGYAAKSGTTPLGPWEFERREPGAKDVRIQIEFCGICHSDIHTVRDEVDLEERGTPEILATHPTKTVYPVVPGHEIIGRVLEVGSGVAKYKTGDRVGVGVICDSCRTCDSCKEGLENYCEPGSRFTYGSFEEDGVTPTYGGYSTHIVTDEHFVLKIPENLDPAAAAPLLCAGITVYSPLRHIGLSEGQKLAVMGLGGLGHVAVKIGASLGAEVTVFSHSPSKEADAERLGAKDFVLTTKKNSLAPLSNRFDVILDTLSAEHDVLGPLDCIKRDGTMIMVGASPELLKFDTLPLMFGRRSIMGSLIGGMAETQEMLDHCGKNDIVSDIELIDPPQINEAYERIMKGDVKYRFVIDCSKF